MCIPLGNYHNMNRAAGRTQAEYIDLADWWSMVRLFLAVARAGHRYDGDLTPLRKRIESRFHRLRRHLRPLSKAAQ
jgi:hypothetical protein